MDRQADVDSAGLDAIWLVQGCKAAASGAPRGDHGAIPRRVSMGLEP
jgi:hypothetical protein